MGEEAERHRRAEVGELQLECSGSLLQEWAVQRRPWAWQQQQGSQVLQMPSGLHVLQMKPSGSQRGSLVGSRRQQQMAWE